MKDWAYLGSWRPAWVALDSVVSNKELPQRKCRVFLLCLAYARSFGNGILKAKGMLCWHTFPFIFLSEEKLRQASSFLSWPPSWSSAIPLLGGRHWNLRQAAFVSRASGWGSCKSLGDCHTPLTSAFVIPGLVQLMCDLTFFPTATFSYLEFGGSFSNVTYIKHLWYLHWNMSATEVITQCKPSVGAAVGTRRDDLSFSSRMLLIVCDNSLYHHYHLVSIYMLVFVLCVNKTLWNETASRCEQKASFSLLEPPFLALLCIWTNILW